MAKVSLFLIAATALTISLLFYSGATIGTVGAIDCCASHFAPGASRGLLIVVNYLDATQLASHSLKCRQVSRKYTTNFGNARVISHFDH